MTNVQKQCLLCYLGFYTGEVDGLWGPASKQATVDFQKAYGLEADGEFGPLTEEKILEAVAGTAQPAEPEETGSFWDEIKYFSREEFRCKCGEFCDGYPAEPDMTMVRSADAIRKRLGVPLIVNSGLRCEKHNANVGGVTNSQHVLGTACDLGAPAGVSPEEMAQVAEEAMGETGGIGIYAWGIHIDSRSTKARWRG